MTAASFRDAPSEGRRARLVYFVTEDWYFVSHRIHLAIAASEAGYDVYVVTRAKDKADIIRRAGLELIPISVSRAGLNPFADIALVFRLYRIYRRIRPDIVHNVALKPVMYGSIAAWMSRVPRVVNAMAGMGFLFASDRLLAKILKFPVKMLMGLLLRNRRTTVILQNPDDVRGFVKSGIARPEQIALILGSGVDPTAFPASQEPEGVPVVVLSCRMIWDKGVAEFVEAARIVNAKDQVARFVLVGDADAQNPASVPRGQLHDWHQEGVVEWWGHSSDMPSVFARSHIVCLPSYYREGIPKVLIEAASSGLPIVTTDAPGCREIVRDGENGLLVPPKDGKALAAALQSLLRSPAQRMRMGVAGREMVVEQFSLDRVISETLAVYRGYHGD